MENAIEAHQINQALRAAVHYQRDREYIVRDGEVVIVDEFTGRTMPGRRWSDGLHQAIEAKEGLRVMQENITLATITFQNFFRLYRKLAGMTGTALTEAEEFDKIYKLEVVPIPTNQEMIRDDEPDLIYRTQAAKYRALVEDIEERHKTLQPILVGTTSIEKSETIARMLEKKGITHEVLNAKLHEREATIVADAGQPGAVTIATNMAGRGTDIVLGGGVADLGGLYIIGTDRHELRRIDNQLRGRAGRQGDPGETRFYLSFEDDLMRVFGGERMQGLMDRLRIDEDVPLESKMVSKQIESAQARVEGHNFDTRRHVVEYDDVMNKQREIIYGERRKILEGIDTKANFQAMVEQVVGEEVPTFCEGRHRDTWDLEGLWERMRMLAGPLWPAFGETNVAQLGDNVAELTETLAGELDLAARRAGGEARFRADATSRAGGDAPGHRPAVANLPDPDGAHARADRLPRVRADGPADRVQAGGLQVLPGADVGDPAGHRGLALSPQPRGREAGRGAASHRGGGGRDRAALAAPGCARCGTAGWWCSGRGRRERRQCGSRRCWTGAGGAPGCSTRGGCGQRGPGARQRAGQDPRAGWGPGGVAGGHAGARTGFGSRSERWCAPTGGGVAKRGTGSGTCACGHSGAGRGGSDAPEPGHQRGRAVVGGDAEQRRGRGQRAGSPRKMGRNERCWCGSGKKYKFCHGR